MTTTGELRAIVQELELVDIGEAASYLGEEALVAEELVAPAALEPVYTLVAEADHLATCGCASCQLIHA